jgi:Zn-dependent protease/predicted transcriptional regulator
MRNWSISAGRVFGIELRIHLTFVALLAFIWMTESANHGVISPARGVALAGIILGSVILHEMAHALAGMYSGAPPKSVVLLPLGGVAQFDETRHVTQPSASAWKTEVRVALAGPLVSLLIAFVAGSILLAVIPGIDLWARPSVISSNLARSFVWVNVWLGLLNLLPAYPLDGGRVLRAVFGRTLDSVRATRRAVSIGQTFATLLMVLGMFVNIWLIMIGIFLFIAAQMEDRSIVFQSVLDTVRLEDIMLTDFATLSPADTLEDALDKAVHSLQDDFPVIRGSDMVGVVSKQKILQSLRSEGNGYVQAVMNRIFEVAKKGETLGSAFRKLNARNLSIIPVVEDERLVGIVTLQNLMHSMTLLAESRKLRKAALEA